MLETDFANVNQRAPNRLQAMMMIMIIIIIIIITIVLLASSLKPLGSRRQLYFVFKLERT
jgi:hypothetical protein